MVKLGILATPVQSPIVAQNMATTTFTASSVELHCFYFTTYFMKTKPDHVKLGPRTPNNRLPLALTEYSPILCTKYTTSSWPSEFSAIHRKKYPDLAGGKNRLLNLEGTCAEGLIALRGTRRHWLASGLQPNTHALTGC